MNRFTQLYKIIALAAILITGILLLNFKLHTNSDKRIRYSINKNGWKFLRDDVKGAYKGSFDDKNWLDVELPHDFNGGIDRKHDDVFQGRFDFKNDADKRLLYKGPAWYRTKLSIDESYKSKRIFIEFEAASLEVIIWVNGKEVGQHQGGYTAFSFDITDFIKFCKPNLLDIRVDNSNNPKIAPWMKDEKKAFPFSFDYAIYGGIYRDVWISITDQLKIENVFNTPLCGGQGPALVSIDTRVKNYSKLTKKVRLTTAVYDPDNKKIAELSADKHILPGEKANFNQTETALGKICYWSPDNPKLYKVKSELSCEGVLIDNYESIFGMRYYTLANNQSFT
jgi:beta-galactosidase